MRCEIDKECKYKLWLIAGVIMNMGGNETVVGGTYPQRMPSCLRALDAFITWDHPIVSSFVRADMGKNKAGGGKGDVILAIAHILGAPPSLWRLAFSYNHRSRLQASTTCRSWTSTRRWATWASTR